MASTLLVATLSILIFASNGVSAIRVSAEGFSVARALRSKEVSLTKTAAFAMGSFWRAEAVYGCVPGVVRTRVGYSGGLKQNPEYRNIGDHAETVEVEYDPTIVRYEQLLDIFWSNHDSTQVFGQGPDVGEQYRSVIFTQGEEEASLAELSKEREQDKRANALIVTEIEPLDTFYAAEVEHQKFELRRRPLLLQLFGELSEEDFVKSTAAAKFNGFVAGMCPPSYHNFINGKVNLFLKYRPKVDELL